MATTKDTIYIDVEDEITAVIDKVTSSSHKIIALVLPKRATVFQSIVNMKLLNKATKTSKKSFVLVTSDKGTIAIASMVKIHIAKTPSSKPYIPETVISQEADLQISHESIDGDDVKLDDNSIILDNTMDLELADDNQATTRQKNKVIKIPDFSSFKIRIILFLGIVTTLIGMWYLGFVILPKATVTVETDVMKSTVNTQITLQLGDAKIDLNKNIIPAQSVQIEKIDSVVVDATGKKDVGNKATGLINLTNCINDGKIKIIPAGTIFSVDSQSFVTTKAVTLQKALYADTSCESKTVGRDKDVTVEATQPGSSYNIKAQSYNSSISGIRAYGSDMTGGSSDFITVISDEDVKKAQTQIDGKSKTEATNELKNKLIEKNLLPIVETLTQGTPEVVVNPAVGSENTSAKVTTTITYSLLGVASDDMNALLNNEIDKILSDKPQNIRNNGLDSVVYQVLDVPNAAEHILDIQTLATIGPKIDETALKNQLAGKKRGEIERTIDSIEGVKKVTVTYSPSWITTTPKDPDKMVIIVNETNSN